MQGRFNECKAVTISLITLLNSFSSIPGHQTQPDLLQPLVEGLYLKYRIEVDHFDDFEGALKTVDQLITAQKSIVEIASTAMSKRTATSELAFYLCLRAQCKDSLGLPIADCLADFDTAIATEESTLFTNQPRTEKLAQILKMKAVALEY